MTSAASVPPRGRLARTYSYDASGNTSADGSRTFTHDARGRLIGTTRGSVSAAYELNALGQRVKKAPSNAPTAAFHYDEDGHLIAESDASGNVTREYVYLGDTPVAVAIGTAQTDLYLLHPDHLDTPRVVTNSASTVVWRWDSADPFGDLFPSEDPDGNGQGFKLNLRFPGQYFDPETQLIYNYFRDYDPQTGRYIQPDPLGLDDGVNVYAYVQNEPLRGLDSLGLANVGRPQDVIIPNSDFLKKYGKDQIKKATKEGIGGYFGLQCAEEICKKKQPPTWESVVEICGRKTRGTSPSSDPISRGVVASQSGGIQNVCIKICRQFIEAPEFKKGCARGCE